MNKVPPRGQLVKYTELDHQSLIGPRFTVYTLYSQWEPEYCLFLSNLSLIEEGAIGQPK